MEAFAAAVPANTVVDHFVRLLQTPVNWAEELVQHEIDVLCCFLDIDSPSCIRTALSVREQELFDVVVPLLKTGLRLAKPKKKACWSEICMKLGSTLVSNF